MIYKRYDSYSSGFSMLELLISVVILSIGLMAIVSMQGTAMQGNTLGLGMTQGYHAGQQQMETLINQDFEAIGNGTGTRKINNITYSIDWQVTEDVYTEGMKTIEMDINWTRKGESKNIQITRSVPEIL